MKDEFILDRQEQLEIITDPLALDIIHLLVGDEGYSKEEIAKELGEKNSIINNYIDRMEKTGFVTLDQEKSSEDKKYYRLSARSIKTSRELIDSMNSAWISGYINFLENKIIDYLEHMKKIEGNKRKYLEELGYYKEFISDFSKVYLTPDEFKEIFDYFKKMLEENSTNERKNDDRYKAYNSFLFLFPDLKRE